MPGYRRMKRWLYPNTVGKFQAAGTWAKATRNLNKFKAAWRGRKVRKTWYAGYKGTLHGGRFKYN